MYLVTSPSNDRMYRRGLGFPAPKYRIDYNNRKISGSTFVVDELQATGVIHTSTAVIYFKAYDSLACEP